MIVNWSHNDVTLVIYKLVSSIYLIRLMHGFENKKYSII